jgi:two-component system, OmpR family, KDP operon response regulator KdpE
MVENALRVLVVDDESQIRRLLRVSLSAQGYQVAEAPDGERGLSAAAIQAPNVVILDLGLPDMDGLDVITRMREWSAVPIIVLSVRDGETEKVGALDRGADDYVTKPFGMEELLARIRAALRHELRAETPEPIFRSGSLTVDLERRVVSVEGRVVRLTPKEYDLLRVLVAHAGKVLTHGQLLRQVWGSEYVHDTQNLRVHIGQLRQKVEPDPARPRFIITEPGVGYRLQELAA